jgi:hypothetical protein
LDDHIKEAVLSEQEKELGMQLFPKSALKYIPLDKESIWLEEKDSQLPNTGIGLYARYPMTVVSGQTHSHSLTHSLTHSSPVLLILFKGTVFCEYAGDLKDVSEAADFEWYPYGVSVHMPDE